MEDLLKLDDNYTKFEDGYRGMLESICTYCKDTYGVKTMNHSYKAKLVGKTYESIFNFWLFNEGIEANIKELCYSLKLKDNHTEIFVKIHWVDGTEGYDQLAKKIGHTAMIALFDCLGKHDICLSDN